nr:MAG TPA: hypothetical protein [Caudoviricetes sp.]
MRKIRIKQSITFVVFLLAVAAMDSQLYITAGVLAILSSIYLLTSSRKEQRDVHGTRGSRTDYRIRGGEGQAERFYMGTGEFHAERRRS